MRVKKETKESNMGLCYTSTHNRCLRIHCVINPEIQYLYYNSVYITSLQVYYKLEKQY